MAAFHLATSNVARMRGAYDDPIMAGFVARLDPLNALADSSPGFVWRYVTPEGDSTEAEVFEDDLVLFNMSVWESIETLEQYVYHSDHVKAVQQRAQWFEKSTRAPMVMWWIEAGHVPTVQEAKARFDRLWSQGPSPDAFTFRNRYPTPP